MGDWWKELRGARTYGDAWDIYTRREIGRWRWRHWPWMFAGVAAPLVLDDPFFGFSWRQVMAALLLWVGWREWRVIKAAVAMEQRADLAEEVLQEHKGDGYNWRRERIADGSEDAD